MLLEKGASRFGSCDTPQGETRYLSMCSAISIFPNSKIVMLDNERSSYQGTRIAGWRNSFQVIKTTSMVEEGFIRSNCRAPAARPFVGLSAGAREIQRLYKSPSDRVSRNFRIKCAIIGYASI